MELLRFCRSLRQEDSARRARRSRLPRDFYLYVRNQLLRPVERRLCARYGRSDAPILFIVGAPRSGTTLLHQLLVSHLDVAYITNFAARYWLAPVYGTRRFERRKGTRDQVSSLRSELGATQGDAGPHEFGYFWSHWMGPAASDQRTEAELDVVRWDEIRSELAGLVGLSGRPLVLKNVNHVDFHVARFARELPNARFVWVVRDPRFVVQSILEARVQRYGNESAWWSIRPRDFEKWQDREPLEQVCHQLREVEEAVARDLARLAPERWVRLDYEELVAHPHTCLTRLSALLEGASLVREAELLALDLKSGNVPRLCAEDLAEIGRLMGR